MNHVFIVFLILICLSSSVRSQSDSAINEITQFQKELNESYKDPKTSPLPPNALKRFKKHEFFPSNLEYRVTARLLVTEATPFFKMKTTTQDLHDYRIFGMVEFSVQGNTFKVPVYQSQRLMDVPEYKDYLFFPFTDLTNGNETYSGGRYIELRIPSEGNELIIDFNKAYNPYCAYNDRYSCPVVPPENHLTIEVKAGTKYKQRKK